MSAPSGPPWTWGPGRGHRSGYVNPELRVSDAERAEVADRLSKHYSDGRLDQDEFNERLDRAMKAKTQSDLAGLFTDLPAAPASPVPQGHQRPHRAPRALFFVLVVVVAVSLGRALAWPLAPWLYVPWLWIGLFVFLWLRYGARPHRR